MENSVGGRLLHWPIASQPHCASIFRTTLSIFTSRPSEEDHYPPSLGTSRPLSAADRDYLTDRHCCGYLHIWFHNGYAFTVVNPWKLLPAANTRELSFRLHNWNMTAQSKVSMQQYVCLHFLCSYTVRVFYFGSRSNRIR